MTLRQVVETALNQNPDIALARLDEAKARQGIRVARDPFVPRITVGSGLAYTQGFPMSVEGSAPTVFQANATSTLFNRPQTYAVAQAKENARGASLAVAAKRDEVAFRAASLYLDAERAARIGGLASKDAESLQRVLDAVRAQVAEGRALPLAEKQAGYELAKARALTSGIQDDLAAAETSLALALGLGAGDRVRPAAEDRAMPAMPASVDAAIGAALDSNKDLRRLESEMLAKRLESSGQKAARLPRADLIAQYGLLAKFNNYDQYFQRFQRNNGQVGVALQWAVFTGPGLSAQLEQTAADLARLRIEYNNARNRISSEIQGSFRQLAKAQSDADLARLGLDVAREQLSVNLSQLEEGRAQLRQVEEARAAENDRWISFYDAQYAVERARWNVLRLTGALAESIEALK
jgi:outer membrane protein TolC